MKRFAIFMIFLVFAAVIAVGYLYFISSVDVVSYGCLAVEAATQPELFEQLKEEVASGALCGTLYRQDADLSDISRYVFYTYTARLRNNTFLTADMVEMQVGMKGDDVLQIGDSTAKALKSHTTGDIQAIILTDRDMDNTRELTLTYYMWGIPFVTRTVYGH